jgi:small subunit ribosomal protein S21
MPSNRPRLRAEPPLAKFHGKGCDFPRLALGEAHLSTALDSPESCSGRFARKIRPKRPRGQSLQVLVRDNNVEQALRVLKKKLQREGVFREMKARRSYEKPSERRAREKAEAVSRSRKAARKLAQREGLIAAPKKKLREARPGQGAPGQGSAPSFGSQGASSGARA